MAKWQNLLSSSWLASTQPGHLPQRRQAPRNPSHSPHTLRRRGRAPLVAMSLALFMTLSATVSCTSKVDENDNTLNVVLRANVKGLDPIRANDLYSTTVIAQIFEGLLSYNYLKRPLELQPELADGMPVVSDGGLTHTFKIKKGVHFQDDPCFPGGKGREVTAEDFIYSWKRLADPSNQSEGFWVFDGKIQGLNEWVDAVKSGKAKFDDPIEGLQAPDANTLVVKLIKPYYQLYYVVAMPFTAVVPKEAIAKYGQEFLNNPVGTGPYRLDRAGWVRNSKIPLLKNPTWRGENYPSEGAPGDKEAGLLEDAGKPLPFANKLVFSEILEDQPRWQNFMKGNFDFAEIPKDNFDTAVKDKKLVPEMAQRGIRLDISPSVDVTYIAFNMKDPILGKSKDLRHAISLANDNETMITKFYNGRAIAAQGPIPPAVAGYDPNYQNPWRGLNVAKAKEWMVKAGYPDGNGLPEFVYETTSDSTNRQLAEFFQQNMAAIGIKIRIGSNSWPQFQEKIKKGQAQIFGIAWGADYPDGQNFLQLFYSKNLSPGPNDAGFVNAEFDKLYEEALNLPPGEKRDELYHKMRDIVVEETPWVFNLHRVGYRTYHGWLNNFKWNDVGTDVYKYVRVDPKKRAELKSKL